jgi:hypothetical protein
MLKTATHRGLCQRSIGNASSKPFPGLLERAKLRRAQLTTCVAVAVEAAGKAILKPYSPKATPTRESRQLPSARKGPVLNTSAIPAMGMEVVVRKIWKDLAETVVNPAEAAGKMEEGCI